MNDCWCVDNCIIHIESVFLSHSNEYKYSNIISYVIHIGQPRHGIKRVHKTNADLVSILLCSVRWCLGILQYNVRRRWRRRIRWWWWYLISIFQHNHRYRRQKNSSSSIRHIITYFMSLNWMICVYSNDLYYSGGGSQVGRTRLAMMFYRPHCIDLFVAVKTKCF